MAPLELLPAHRHRFQMNVDVGARAVEITNTMPSRSSQRTGISDIPASPSE
jgi:hypothetical protein